MKSGHFSGAKLNAVGSHPQPEIKRHVDSVAAILHKKGRLNHSFSTSNTFIPGEHIHIELLDGPFKKLIGDWHFVDLSGQGCKIELKLEFEFSSTILSKLVGPIFTQIANSLVDAFCQRAHQLYRNTA